MFLTIRELLIGAARAHADRVAIDEGDRTVTYRELFDRAWTFAATVHAGDVVELAATRSADFVVRCIGAWLAGAAWAPIDPSDPRGDRLRTLIAAARGAHELAYVIATSGSSGEPKAVMVSHRGLPGLVRAQIEAFALAPGARALWLHAPVFDASISDWTTALVAGGTLVIPSGALLRTELERRGITHVDLPTALLSELAEPPAALRVVVLGGAPCPPERVAALAERVRVVVVYGPTEATICSSLVIVDPARWTRPVIGEPLRGITYRIVDGELWIAGPALAIGYAGDPAETERRFVDDAGVRYYRTGDRVEPTRDGIAFIGRIDRQHKLGGGRIELDEIEVALRRCPGVRDAAACVRGSRLIAFVEGGEPAAVRDALRAQLPRWMVPAQIVAGSLPRTASGKVDHAALVVPPRRIAETDPLAAELAALWCDALGTNGVERDDRFNGDSLAVITLHAAATARGIALDPTILAANPSFAEVIAHVRAATTALLTVGECEARGLAAVAAARPEAAPSRPGDSAESSGAATRAATGAAAPRAVLITGATGTLGAHLVAALRGREVIALVRAADDPTARRRVACEAIRGDVAAPQFGLRRDQWDELAARVGTVIHAAATIRLGDGWDGHAATNVRGTVEVVRFAAVARAAWHHISTLSVFVGTDDRRARFTPDMLPDPEAHVHGGYAATKLAAEAIARGSATTIVRLGLLANARQLAMTIRGLVALGAAPAGCDDLRFDVTPVEHAAAAITRAIAVGGIHHVASAHGAPFGDLVAALGLATLPFDAWADRARARFADPDVAMAYLALSRRPGFDLFLARDFGAAAPAIDLVAIVAGAMQ